MRTVKNVTNRERVVGNGWTKKRDALYITHAYDLTSKETAKFHPTQTELDELCSVSQWVILITSAVYPRRFGAKVPVPFTSLSLDNEIFDRSFQVKCVSFGQCEGDQSIVYTMRQGG